MERESLKVLTKFYDSLREELLKNNSLDGNSIFTTLLQFNSNKRKELIFNSSLDPLRFDFEDLNLLKNQDYLQEVKGGFKTDKPVLTAKGIWKIDKEKFGFTEEDLIDFFQEKDFDFTSEIKPLNSKEKLALFTLISVRCFSSDSLMNLKDETFRDNWVKVLHRVNDYLVENKIIKKNNILKPRGKSNPARYLMRRVNNLPKKTSQVYKYTGSYKYYLDIFSQNLNSIDEDKLAFLFKLIFEKVKLTIQLVRKTSDFCNNLAYDEARYVKSDNKFLDNKYDKVIDSSIKSVFIKG